MNVNTIFYIISLLLNVRYDIQMKQLYNKKTSVCPKTSACQKLMFI